MGFAALSLQCTACRRKRVVSIRYCKTENLLAACCRWQCSNTKTIKTKKIDLDLSSLVVTFTLSSTRIIVRDSFCFLGFRIDTWFCASDNKNDSQFIVSLLRQNTKQPQTLSCLLTDVVVLSKTLWSRGQLIM